MTILDDARPGMDPETRPQDDLFGHVNGRWLTEAEIPSDRSSWGAFVKLADDAEQQVREIIEGLADRVESDGDGGVDEDARKIGALYASFMDEVRINKLGLRPVQPLLSAVDALRDVRDLAAFLGEFERVGGYGLFGSYVNTDDRDSDRYVLNIFQGGLGLPDESYCRDPGRAEDLQPDHRRGAPAALPVLRLARLRHQPGRPRRRLRPGDRREHRAPAVVPSAPVHGARRGADRAVARVAPQPRAARGCAVPVR
jgi:predicted metalloendopeptidase